MKILKKAFLLFLFCALFAATLPASFPQTVSANATNLVSGMEYAFEMSEPTVHSYSRYTEGGEVFDADDGRLTDGKKAVADPEDKAWLTSFRSRSRYVTFDFGREVAVSGAGAGFWHGNGYYAPRYVRLYLSDDGKGWFLAGQDSPPFALNSAPQRYDAVIETEVFRARYARVEFCVDIFTRCDEIEVFGSTEVPADASGFTPDPEEKPFFCAGIEGDPYDVTDIIKLYDGYYPSNQDKVKNDPEELLPYIAYLDENGEIMDTMFDAVAFVPCVSTDFPYPSGGTLGRHAKFPPAVMSDWIYYADYLFEKGYELDALDQTVKRVYTALGIEGKFPVLLTMLYPGVSDLPFGDLDGDGSEEYRRTNEERVSVVRWYDAYLTKRFAQQEYEYLDFVGYYWYNEEVNSTWSEDEEGYVRLAAEAIRENGKSVLYDPFYLSTGYDEWKELGFSAAVMQPNLAFTDHRPYYEQEMLFEFAETIANRHLGVEIETNEPSYFRGEDAETHAKIYEKYLFVGSVTGYMDALHTFYQGAGPGTLYDFCFASGDKAIGKRLRRLYDKTYEFIKGRYVNEPPVFTLSADRADAVSGEKCAVPITVTDEDSFWGDVTVTVSEPSHGYARVSADKSSVVYVPEEGFSGTEVLTLTADDGQNEPLTATLTITVTEDPGSEKDPSDASGVPSDASSDEEKTGGSVLPVILISAAVLLLGVVVAVVLLRRKKRG